MTEARRASVTAASVLAVLALVLFTDGIRRWWPRTVDDAFIVFRYAQNWVEGHGPVYNPGERVEGYTSPLWMTLHAAGLAGGIEPVALSKAIGVAASVLLLVALGVTCRRAGSTAPAAATAVLALGASAVFQIWAVSGLETNLFATLLFLGLALLVTKESSAWASFAASAALSLAALTRPEGLVYWACGFAFTLTGPRRGRGRRVGWYLLPATAWLAHLAWRFAYYGELVPNTYYAKTGGGTGQWLQGLHGLGLFARNLAHWPWLVLAAAGTTVGLLRKDTRRGTALMAGVVILHLLHVIAVGDDGLAIHRFYVPILAPLAWLAVLTLRDDEARTPIRWPTLAATAAVALSVAGSLMTLHGRLLPGLHSTTLAYQEGNEKLGRHLAATREPGTWIAVAAAGAIPYYSRLPAIDMYGLNEATIAKGPFPKGRRGRFMKWDVEHVLRREPELIAVNRGYFSAGDARLAATLADPAELVRADLDRALFERLGRGDRRYELRPLGLGDGSVFFVFERRD